MTSKSPVGDISVVTLIRTDTTLDHSQKAEKVCYLLSVLLYTSQVQLDMVSVSGAPSMDSTPRVAQTKPETLAPSPVAQT